MDKPEIAQKAPYKVELKPGRQHWWCACGRSKAQPYCDGSHSGTGINPMEVKSDKTEVWLCGCKQTKTPPFCDGSHNDLD